MGKWINFRKVKDWAVENVGATDCSSKCHECEKTWVQIRNEDRGEEYLHMIDAKVKTPCGIPFNFVCDTCYQQNTNKYES